MKRLFGWIGKGAAQPTLTHEPTPKLSLEQVGEFTRHFPIGTRLHYYPEYQRNIKLDSLILGYRIEGHFVYSDQAVRVQQDGGGAALTLKVDGGVQRLSRVDQFQFLVPFKSRSEMDYPVGPTVGDTFTEKAVNDFKRGNTITLFNKGANGKVPHLDAEVTRVMDMREGVYTNRRVVLLEPDPESFQFVDQRQYHRVYAQIPALLSAELDGTAFPCVVHDFSERFLRIGWDETVEWLSRANVGLRVYLSIPVVGRAEPFTLLGNVHRKGEAYAVIALNGIFKQKRFQKMDLIDELDLKTSLLQHPETQQTLVDEDYTDG